MKHRILMASDFFYPNVGGVEEHIYSLSQCLIARGHKVVVVTHSYGKIVGVRWLPNGLKVFYLPLRTFYNGCILPTMIATIPYIRHILVQERITLVHGHAAFSTIAHEAMNTGRLMGLHTVFTDHSLFGFADSSAIITNMFLRLSLVNCTHCICVSHIGKENTVLRAKIKQDVVSVIPNAVDTKLFTPQPERRSKNRITIVIVCRLVYRKGVDFMINIIPFICNNFPDVQFYIVGDGPKREALEEMWQKEQLGDRMQMFGALDLKGVRDVLVQGHIFLNTSLTEAFCMAIVEASCCGLHVVSTNVGGIPEVLPADLMYLAEPDVNSLILALEKAILDTRDSVGPSPFERHKKICSFYNWYDVSERTENIYNTVVKLKPKPFGQQLSNCLHQTKVYPFLLVLSLCYLIIKLFDWYRPRYLIDIAPDYPSKKRTSFKLNGR
ncbi:phosphatidylinositol N-acetylglucosaminyltransferase subunit A [Neocloeon triangulifer]|uniref:phosphatidylinositol N-acetylglucosaminyltransferase subunit A n=1 Tax=Neocloeon triangulifer TaxID=2078957 RepID=UPI00286F665C|nr:phosphatidylinositol N-acetylglucosaminyltransferase subunit A [Neocloeon triangulifer]